MYPLQARNISWCYGELGQTSSLNPAVPSAQRCRRPALRDPRPHRIHCRLPPFVCSLFFLYATCSVISYPTQTRNHLPFKACPEWKGQQEILWVEVLKESGRRKSRCKIRDFLADGRCSKAVPDFPSTTDVGRLVPPEEDAGSEVSERKAGSAGSAGSGRRGERRRRNLVLGRNYRCPYLHPPLRHPQTRCRGRVTLSFVLSSVIFTLSCVEGKGELAASHRARTADRKRTAMIHLGMREIVKQKNHYVFLPPSQPDTPDIHPTGTTQPTTRNA